MRFKLIKHNDNDQILFGNHQDTKQYLILNQIYKGEKEVHSWHTKIIITGKSFNSVCFKEIPDDDVRNNRNDLWLLVERCRGKIDMIKSTIENLQQNEDKLQRALNDLCNCAIKVDEKNKRKR